MQSSAPDAEDGVPIAPPVLVPGAIRRWRWWLHFVLIGTCPLLIGLFRLGHAPQGPIAVCLTGLLGLGLGGIMIFHKSIWPAVIAHGLFDATSLAVLPWALDNVKEFHK